MCRQDLVLGQDAVNGRAKAGVQDLLRAVTEDVVDREVGAHALADRPALDVGAECDNLSGHVGPRHNVLL